MDLADHLAALGPTRLDVDARLTLHWALQPVAAFGFGVLPPTDDFLHTAVRWSSVDGTLRSAEHEATGLQVALGVGDFALRLVRGDEDVDRLALDGRGLDEAHAWLARALQQVGLLSEDAAVTRPEHTRDMPAHPVADGAVFRAPSVAQRQTLAHWLAIADGLLNVVKAELPGAGPIRCWPHHFDTATLHVVSHADGGGQGEGASTRSIGLGLSPGDGSYDQPYLYVTPWPYPDLGDEPPPLPSAGIWHTEGWTGAVLRAQDLLAASDDGSARAEAALTFLRGAHAAAQSRRHA